MPKAVKEEKSAYFFPNDVWFDAILTDVEEESFEFHVGKKKGAPKYNADGTPKMDVFTKWTWKFTIQGGEFDEMEVEGETRPEYTTRPGDKVREWSEALLGEELSVGAELDTDLLLGSVCQIRMDHMPERTGRDGETYYDCRVGEVVPAGTHITADTDPPF